MTDASPQGNEARDVLPIVFLGNDDRFKDNDLQRSRDFRPHVLPADAPLPGRHLDNGPYSPAAKREQREREEEQESTETPGPKVSPATDPASGSDGASPTSPPASPADPASVEKEPTPPPLVPPLI